MASPAFTTTEGTLALADSHELYTKTWHPSSQAPMARLIFVHGFSDHCNFYGVLFSELARAGIATHAYDQRGWGRSVHSPAEKGRTGSTQVVMDDLTAFIQHVLREQIPAAEPQQQAAADVPFFLMGHSMGGGEVLYWAATAPKELRTRIRGYLVESPFIALHESAKPWRAEVVLGRLASKLLPRMQMVRQLPPDALCRDEDVVKAFVADPLCHDTGTLEGLAGMLDRAEELEKDKVVVKDEGGQTRLWVAFGTGDRVLSEDVCKTWFQRLKVQDKEYRAYEGFYHKLHAEPGDDKFVFAKDVAEWILQRSGSLESLAKPKL